jgi:hypothetical protein
LLSWLAFVVVDTNMLFTAVLLWALLFDLNVLFVAVAASMLFGVGDGGVAGFFKFFPSGSLRW